jgi:hypothetical protein
MSQMGMLIARQAGELQKAPPGDLLRPEAADPALLPGNNEQVEEPPL